ncbi:MAG: hypothetical protein KAX65_04660 [Caldilineaceae bacterium]|nr:hypothetical protein [Caldilineaceae bacterium]
MIDLLLPAIEAAKLPPTLYRTAVRIAALTDGNGVARLEWGAMLDVAGTTSKETARGQLDRLITAGVFQCKRNHSVLVVWQVPPAELRESRRFPGSGGESYANRVGLPVAAETSEPAELRESRRFPGSGGESYANRVGLPVAAETSEPAELRESRRFPGSGGESYANRVGLPVAPIGKVPTGKVGRKDQPTYLPDVEGVQGEPQPPTDAERSLALLTDPAVGVTGKLLEIVALYPFEQIRLQVFQALREMAEKRVKSIGVIRHRLAVGAAATVTDADRTSALWLRHQTDDEGEAERRRKYMPAEYADIIIG